MSAFHEIKKIIKDHHVKSDQLRQAKKKLKNSVPVGKLKEMLAREQKYEIDANDYMGLDNFDDEGYAKADAKKEARIELLNQLIDGR